MKTSLKAVLLALAVSAVSLGAAQAAEHVELDFGSIAFGYTDGYWDRGHHWHRWAHHRDWERWRDEHRDHAFEYRHTHDRDHGWRDRDRYWEHG